MSCNEMQKFLDPYLDDELDLVNILKIEQHLQDCVACQARYQNLLALRKGFKDKSLYYELPPTLQKRVHTALVKSQPRRPSFISGLMTRSRVGWSVAVAFVLLLVMAGTGLTFLNLTPNDTNRASNQLGQEILDSHLRSLMLNHLEDVVSTDQHTVKPWFNGKLDFSPVVEDFAGQGYPLIGGRLDYVDNKPAAVLVYERGKHIINVYIWRNNSGSGSKTDSQTSSAQGYNLINWATAGFNYWVVSDLNETDLASFVQLLKSATG